MATMDDSNSQVFDEIDFVTPKFPGFSPNQRRLPEVRPIPLRSISEIEENTDNGDNTDNADNADITENGEVESLIVKTVAPPRLASALRMDFSSLDAASRYSRSSSKFSRQSSVTGELYSLKDMDCQCGDQGLTGWDCMYTNEDDLVWSPRDVNPNDVDTYMKVLSRDVINNSEVLRREIQHVCRMNFACRLEVICEALAEKNIGLDSETLVGEMTETPLHVALMYDSSDAARVLIKYGGPSLILKKYEHPDFEGTTALHKAITKQNRQIMQEMLENLNSEQKNHILHQQASGCYFRGKFLKTGLPLSLAALVGNKDIFDDLVQYGAQVDAIDARTGNNVIHSLANFSMHRVEEAKEMYHHILTSPLVQQWWLKRRGLAGLRMTCTEYRYMKINLLKKMNFEGFTPLALSTSKGCSGLCSTILKTDDVYRFPQWKIGPTSFNFYDISEIDPSVMDFGQPCVMDLFLYGPDTKGLSFCDVPVISELLKRKWECYRWIFYPWFLFHLFLMLMLTMASERRLQFTSLPSNQNDSTAPYNETTTGNPHNFMAMKRKAPLLLPEEYIILITTCLYLFVDVFDTFRTLYYVASAWWNLRKAKVKLSLLSFVRNVAMWRPDIFRAVLICFSLSYISVFILRIMDSKNEVVAMAMACVFGWIFMLSFTRAVKSIGVFTVMLQRMFLGDLLHFFIVFVVILIGFSVAFRILFFNPTTSAPFPEEISDLRVTFFNFWRLVCGLSDLDIFEQATHPSTVKLLFLGFVLLANILLLNMLIAAMSDTYAAVTNQKHNLWLKIRAKSVSLIEQHLPCRLRPKLKLEHRQRLDDQGKVTDLWLLPVEEIILSSK